MFRRVAGVAAASLLLSGLSATSAFAATPVSTTDLTAALQASLAATTAAAKVGFSAAGVATTTVLGNLTVKGSLDPVHHRADVTFLGIHSIEAAGVGSWTELPAKARSSMKAELELLGKPGATYEYVPNAKLSAAEVDSSVPSPVGDLTDILAESITSATSSTDATGATTYALTADLGKGDTATQTVVLNADKTLKSFADTEPGLTFSDTYRYGRQTVNAPAAAVTVTQAQVAAAHAAVVQFDARVKARAGEVAAAAKKLAKNAHRSKVTLADIRKAAASVAAAHKNDLVRVTVTAVTGGVKLRAVRPVSHKPIAFTVTVKGGQPVVKAA